MHHVFFSTGYHFGTTFGVWFSKDKSYTSKGTVMHCEVWGAVTQSNHCNVLGPPLPVVISKIDSIVPYYLQSALVLSFHIVVVLTLSFA